MTHLYVWNTRVPSLSRADKAYRITADLMLPSKLLSSTVIDTSDMTCDCPAFDFSRARPKRCKHTEIATKAIEIMRRCVETHGGVDYGVCGDCLIALMATMARRVKKAYRPKPEKKGKRAKAARRDGSARARRLRR